MKITSSSKTNNENCHPLLKDNSDSFFLHVLTSYIKPEEYFQIEQRKDIQVSKIKFKGDINYFLQISKQCHDNSIKIDLL